MRLPERSIWGHLMVLVVWGSGFYSLILSPFPLDDLSKGAMIGFMGLALQWEFGTAIQAATAKQAAAATAASATSQPTVTASAGPPVTVTSTPAPPAPILEEDVLTPEEQAELRGGTP